MLDYTNADTQDAGKLTIRWPPRQLLDGALRYTIGFWYQRRRTNTGAVIREKDVNVKPGLGVATNFSGASGDIFTISHNNVTSTNSPSVTIDVTYSYLVTWDEHEGMIIYQDGVSWHTDATLVEIPTVPKEAALVIGATASGIIGAPGGYLGNVAIWPGFFMNSVDAEMWHSGVMPHYNSCRFFYRGTSVPARDEVTREIPDCFVREYTWPVHTGFRFPFDFKENIWQAADPSDSYYDVHAEMPDLAMRVLSSEELNRRRLVRKTYQITVPTEFYARELMDDLQLKHKDGLEHSGEGFGYGGSPERLARIESIALRPEDRLVELGLVDMKRRAMSYYNSLRSPLGMTERADGLFRLAPLQGETETTRDSLSWAMGPDGLFHEFGIDQAPLTPEGLLIEGAKPNYVDNPAFKHGLTGWTDASMGDGAVSAMPSGGGIKVFRPYTVFIDENFNPTTGYTEVQCSDPGDPVSHDDATTENTRNSAAATSHLGFYIDPTFAENMLKVNKVVIWARARRTDSNSNDNYKLRVNIDAGYIDTGPNIGLTTSWVTSSWDCTASRDWTPEDFRNGTLAFVFQRGANGPTTEVTSLWMAVEFEGEAVPKLFHASVTQLAAKIYCAEDPDHDYGALQQEIGVVDSSDMCLSWWHWDESGEALAFSLERHSDGFFIQALDGTWDHDEVFLEVPLALIGPERFRLPHVLGPGVGENYTLTLYSRNAAHQSNWIFHVQMEEGMFPTSPIVGETGTYEREPCYVTVRNPDSLTIPAEHATIALEFVPTWDHDESGTGNTKYLFRLQHDSSNFIQLYWGIGSARWRVNWSYAGTNHFSDLSGLCFDAGDPIKVGVRWLDDGELGKESAQGQVFIHMPKGKICDEYAESNQDSWFPLNNTYNAVGQSFKGDGGKIGSVGFYLKKTGSPTGNYYVAIYSHLGVYGSTGVPGGEHARSELLDVEQITASAEFIRFDIDDDLILEKGTAYFAVLVYFGGDASNYLEVGYDASSPTHGGNAAPYIAAWTPSAGADVVFEIRTDPNSWQESEPVEFTTDLAEAAESLFYFGRTPNMNDSNPPDGVLRYFHVFPEALPFEEIQALFGD
ncbi:MAG: hypothetical protein GY769_04385 [bacterium]|nr:hypothetical protein [bacterium]